MLVLRLSFVLLLYLFLFSLVAAIRRDLRRAGAPVEARRGPRTDGRLIVLSGGPGLENGRSMTLAPLTTIGRAPSSDVRLDDALVSGQHARLEARNGRWYLADLDSTNGTLLNQQPISGEHPIEYGDVISIGNVRLKLAR